MELLTLIDTRLPNLHTSLKTKLLATLSSLHPCKKYILYSAINSFKEEHRIIAVGKFTKRYWLSRGWPEDQISELTNSNPRNKTNLSSPMTIDLSTHLSVDMEKKKELLSILHISIKYHIAAQ
jgi:hypothetical protein